MVRVKRAGLRWRALRPVLLAGAATVSWLTFSSTAANADPVPSSPSILGNVTSSVPAAPATLTQALPALTLYGNQDRIAELGGNGVGQPFTADLPGAAADLISSVPLIEAGAGGPIAGVTEQVRKTAGSLVGGTAETVSGLTGPLMEAVAGVQPAVQPLLDQTQQAQLPDASRTLSPLPERTSSAAPGIGGTADAGTDNRTGAWHDSMRADPATAVEAPGTSPAKRTNGASVVPGAAGGKAMSLRTPSPDVAVLPGGGTQPLDRSPYPLHVPSAPAGFAPGTFGSTAGSDHADHPYPFSLHGPPAGVGPLGNLSKHAPSPASYDPGSSPD